MHRRPYLAATFLTFACAVGIACGSSDSTGTGGSSSTSSSSSSTSSSSSSSSSTGTGGGGGAGGGLSNEELCAQGLAKLESCGLGGGGAPPCDDRQACRSQCMLDWPCSEIQVLGNNYSNCMYCCDNPGQCT